MIEIIAAPLAHLHKEQHLGLVTEMDHLLTPETITLFGIEPLVAPFKEAVAVETAALGIEQGNLNTGKMEEADAEREDLITGFNHLLENGIRHFDLTKQNAAQILKHIVAKYGSMRRKPNADETVAFRGLTNELLSAENLPYVSVLSDSMDWITRMQVVNERYGALFVLRNKETKETHVVSSLEAREVTNPCYKAIVKRINALAEVNGEAKYSSFINQLNGIIESYKNTMAVQQAARLQKAATKDTEAK